MTDYIIDLETKSDLPIEAGIPNYLNTPSSDIVFLGWKERGNSQVNIWSKGNPVLFDLTKDYRVFGHNIAGFDQPVWNTLGKKYNFPHLPLSQCVDSMAVCGRFSLPQKLDLVAKALNLRAQKGAGKALIQKITQPPFEHTYEELMAFKEYCKQDVLVLEQLVEALPADDLTGFERRMFEMTVGINRTGIPVDTRSIRQILRIIKRTVMESLPLIADITDGEIQKFTQTVAIRRWINEQGVPMPNIGKDTVEQYLKKDLPPKVRELLEFRLKYGKSSTAKYEVLSNQVHNDRIYNNLRYYGAGPGRWAGLGAQFHNLPRQTVDKPEEEIEKFYDFSIIDEDPIDSAKALIRPMVKAPEGKKLVVIDYSGIEDRLLCYAAGQWDVVEDYRHGLDAYRVAATDAFGLPYDAVEKWQRNFCKPQVLGCGYGQGGPRLCAYAESMGVDMPLEEGYRLVELYRTKRKKIIRFWYDMKDAAVLAIENKGYAYENRGFIFQVREDRTGREWLQFTLLSGRPIFYAEPELKEDTYGWGIAHKGINSKTKQWESRRLIPGRITENAIQGLARDVLGHGKLNLLDNKWKLLLSIHDETITEINDEGDKQNQYALDEQMKCLLDLPEWAKDIPLAAEGFVTKRFRKG